MRSSVRWFVPVAVAATVAGGVAINSAVAGDVPTLPKSSPQKVLEALAAAHVTAMSGTVVTRADLGLPSLPQLGDRSSSSATDMQGLITRFLTGDNTLRVWADGPTRERVQLMDPFDELNVVRNGDELWTYDSRKDVAQHGTVPKEGSRGAASKAAQSPSTAQDLTPAQMAQRALDAAGPTTSVTLGRPEQVASRSAYALTLTPKTSDTLVGRIVIAVDSEKGVPLQVQVFARGKKQPVIETGFTSVDFARPAASTFTFTPPKGATVQSLPAPGTAPKSAPGTSSSGDHTSGTSSSQQKPTTIGTGWSSITELPAGSVAAMTAHAAGASGSSASGSSASGSSASGSLGSGATDGNGRNGAASGQAMLRQLTTPVTGGRALTSSLLSVLITDDGRILAGAVPLQSLIDAAKK